MDGMVHSLKLRLYDDQTALKYPKNRAHITSTPAAWHVNTTQPQAPWLSSHKQWNLLGKLGINWGISGTKLSEPCRNALCLVLSCRFKIREGIERFGYGTRHGSFWDAIMFIQQAMRNHGTEGHRSLSKALKVRVLYANGAAIAVCMHLLLLKQSCAKGGGDQQKSHGVGSVQCAVDQFLHQPSCRRER